MSDDVDEILSKSQRLDCYDHVDPNDGDGYVTVHLHQHEDGRYLRYIEASGYNFIHGGAGHFIEWLGDTYDDTWKEP